MSDIEKEDIFNIKLNDKYEEKREKSIEARDTKYNYIFEGTIDTNRAREYRSKYGKDIKSSKWTHLDYKFYMI